MYKILFLGYSFMTAITNVVTTNKSFKTENDQSCYGNYKFIIAYFNA